MKKNRTISIDDEVWEMLEEIAGANFTSKSDMIQRLIIEEHKQQTDKQ